MDDDVQYLGTKLAAAPDIVDDLCEVQLLLTGITLHVEKWGEKPAHDLTFYRASSSFVNIGRKSGSDDRSMRRENDDHNAVFTCPVVSAKHAKLVLSDSGQAHIVDLLSRHGTHLLRRGETAPRMLQPGVETLLADGDVLTFGKVVGAGSYHVSPVTVRVELLTGLPSSDPSVDHALSSSHPSSPTLGARPRKLSSGRYGLLSADIVESDFPQSSSSISSDCASSPSEQESDLEDDSICIPAILRDSQGKPSVKIPAFRNFIREMCHNTDLHSPAISDLPDVPLDDAPGSPPSVDVIMHPSPIIVPDSFPKSRSQSPIPLIMSPPLAAQQPEPAVIGAWPASRPDSPRQPSLEVESGQPAPVVASLVPEPEHEPEPPVPVQPSPSPIRTTPIYSIRELMQCLNSNTQTSLYPGSGPFSSPVAPLFERPSIPPPPPPIPYPLPPRMYSCRPFEKIVTERVNTEIKESLKSVEDRIATLQETVGDIKSRQSVTEDDVVDIQSHVEMLEPDAERLLCRITGAERNIATLSTLQGQMTTLQNQVTALRERVDTPQPTSVETPMDDVRACANALTGLVSEMKALREDVEKRIEDKVDAIKNARAEALDALKGVVAEVESARSSKRKREDEEMPEAVESADHGPLIIVEEMPLPEVFVPPIYVPPVPVSVPDVVVPVSVPEVPAPEVPTPEVTVLEVTRPKKRARTAMYTVAHTAAAMAIGAAATWSALAFS